MSLLAACHVALALAVAEPTAERPPLVIPDEVYLKFSTEPTGSACEGEDGAAERARLEMVTRTTYGDELDFTGHVESMTGNPGAPSMVSMDGLTLRILGRDVRLDGAEISGGGREGLRAGALVRVVGTGSADGSVRARKIEIWPASDPQATQKLDREVEKFKVKYWKKAKRYEDPELVAYVNQVAARLAPSYLPATDRKVQIQVVRDGDLNAFALPDGTIVLHTGILARMENEVQLATVLAHEMAHVTQRHALRAMAKETEHTLLGWGSFLASLALGVAGRGDAAQGVQLMSSAWLSGYSRNHEDEADLVGLRYVYLAGYDVAEAPAIWRTFQILYGDPTREQNFFYGSHSTGKDREFNLSHEIWRSYEPLGLLGGGLEREEFLKKTARLVRENALVDLERGNLAWAEWAVTKSLAISPEDASSHVALGRIALKRGDSGAVEQAIDAFRHAIELDPAAAVAYRELGFVLSRTGDRPGARAAFERYLALEPAASDAPAVRRALERI